MCAASIPRRCLGDRRAGSAYILTPRHTRGPNMGRTYYSPQSCIPPFCTPNTWKHTLVSQEFSLPGRCLNHAYTIAQSL